VAENDPDEETVVASETEGAAGGRRWWLSLTMVVLSVLAVAAGVVFDQWLLIVGGIFGVLLFALIAAGSSGGEIGLFGLKAKLDLPQDRTVRTEVRKRGFPKRPPGKLPEEDDEEAPPRSDA
jgi:hypothetical protein